ncbi:MULTISPECIES: dephospho-CoA kinase [unclassified Thioalkalivibrio]|uniref:dephospho-CoA kinase n=1 Tax=unclassified Thioalkalivibrio TaxID=2621013 RepID=UPI0004774630|nr:MULTISPECIES: dephospho-CoA kinase [unclassified Thioalkalivibrio]PYG03086.1 dephospho-CoA kinase [Thioalkalivibrio sp. ALE21]
MERAGLTGGIGSGKSRVAALFAEQGIPVLDADRVTRELQEPGQPLHGAIVEHFGPGILDPRGHLDRRALATRVFADSEEREALEAIVHPAVRDEIHARLKNSSREAPYALIVVPLLFEAGWETDFFHVLTVECTPEEQIERVTRRDDRTREEVRAIMERQLGTDARRRRADTCIDNHDGIDDRQLRDQVLAADRHLRTLTSGG